MGRVKTSSIWAFYSQEEGAQHLARCKSCSKVISRGKAGCKAPNNGGMLNHLQRIHKEEYEKYKAGEEGKKTKDVKDETVRGTIPIFKLKNHAERREFQKLIFPTGRPNLTTDEMRDKQMDFGILTMIILDFEPFNFVSRPGFLTYTMGANPDYIVKSNNYYRGLVDKAFKVGKATVKAKIEKDNPEFVSLQTDGWTAAHTGYMGGICSYITDDWQRESVVLACTPYEHRHTSENIAEWIMGLCEEWDISHKLGTITSDSAANMLGIYNTRGFPSTYSKGQCANHMIQRCIETEVFSIERVKNIIDNVRAVNKFANQSNNFCNDLERLQKEENPDTEPLLLAQDVPTRWNSTFTMLERFAKLKDFLIPLLASQEWSSKPSLVKAKLRHDDWDLMNKVIKVLQVFSEATLKFSHGSACISEVIPVVTMLLGALDKDKEDMELLGYKFNMRSKLRAMMGGFEEQEIYGLATIVDPRYKDAYFVDPEHAAAMKDKLINIIKSDMEDDTTEPVLIERRSSSSDVVGEESNHNISIIEQISKKIRLDREQKEVMTPSVTPESVVEDYLKAPLEDVRCLRFWREYEQKSGGCKVKTAFLHLVKKYLTPPPTSTNVERLFSYAGLIADPRRARLQPERLEKILFLRENLAMLAFKLEWE